MDNKLFFKESVLPVTLFCSALMFSPIGATQVNAATNVVLPHLAASPEEAHRRSEGKG